VRTQEFEMNKKILLVSLSLFLSIPLFAASQKVSIGTFSNKEVNPDEGDCLGREVSLWKEGDELRGQLKPYEGNCEVEGIGLMNLKYDGKTGALSFEAPGSPEQFIWLFQGNLQKDKLVGTLDLVNKGDRKASPNIEKIILKKVAPGN
jgi:hypothetical protein